MRPVFAILLAALLITTLLWSWWPRTAARPHPAPAARATTGQPATVTTMPATRPGDALITGRIVDELGTALTGVRVAAEPDTGTWQLTTTSPTAARFSASTDHDGRFRLSTRGVAAVAVVARHRHFAPAVIARALPTAGGQDHELGEITVPTIAGLLVEVRGRSSGLPIQDAEVQLTRSLARADLPAFAAATATLTATTDAEGLATFFGVEVGSWRLAVRARGRATRQLSHEQPARPQQAPRVLVELDRGEALVGRVLDAEGAPVADALIACTRLGKATPPPRQTTRSGADGQFLLEGLARGKYRVEVESLSHGIASQDPWNPSDGFLTIRLPAGQEVHGRVLSAQHHRPIAGAQVTLESASGWPVLRDGKFYRPQTLTDDDGIFRFRCVPAGIVRLTVTSKDLCPAQLGPIQPSGERLILLLEEGFRIRGKVLSPAGLPLSNAVIQTAYHDAAHIALPGLVDRVVTGRAPLPTVRSAAGGRFEIRGLAPGSYRLVIRSPGLPPVLSEPFTATANQHQDLGPIALARGGQMEGFARHADGQPASGATVYLYPKTNLPFAIAGAKARCDARGHFRLPIVAPGSYRMFYDYPDTDTPRRAAARRAATGLDVRVLDQQVQRRDLTPRVR